MSVGYADWQRTRDWQGEALVTAAPGTLNTSKTLPRVHVSRWHAIQLHAQNTTADHRIQLDWYSAQSGGLLLGRQVWDINLGAVLRWAAPNYGPWLEVTVFAPAAAGTHSHDLWIQPTNRAVIPNAKHDTALLVSTGAQSVAAGVPSVVNFAHPYHGPAHAFIDTDAVAWEVELRQREYNGTARIFERWLPVVAYEFPRRIFVPTRICDARLVNNDAGARNFRVEIVPDYSR